MSNWSNLTTLLFGAGFGLIVLTIVVMLIRVASDKKMYSGGMKFLTTIMILLFLCGGVSIFYKDKIPEDIQSLKLGVNLPSGSTTTTGKGVANESVSQIDGNSKRGQRRIKYI